MALIIPVQARGVRGNNKLTTLLIVVLEEENLERMRAGDPFDVQARTINTQSVDLSQPVSSLDLVICYERDINEVYKRMHNLPELLRYLERDRHHQPGDGTAPVSVKDKRGD